MVYYETTRDERMRIMMYVVLYESTNTYYPMNDCTIAHTRKNNPSLCGGTVPWMQHDRAWASSVFARVFSRFHVLGIPVYYVG